MPQDSSGAWTIRNDRTGRHYLDAVTADNAVRWNAGSTVTDSLWGVVPAPEGFRLDNSYSDRDYMYATSAGEVKWNTGSTDGSAVWLFERKQSSSVDMSDTGTFG